MTEKIRDFTQEPKATMLDAALAAHIMQTSPLIKGIEVFGSTARDGMGNDLDLMFLTDTATWKRYDNAYALKEVFSLTAPARDLRQKAAEQVFGPSFAAAIKDLQRTRPTMKWDVMVLPEDWRTETLPSDTPAEILAYLEQLKKDAIRIV